MNGTGPADKKSKGPGQNPAGGAKRKTRPEDTEGEAHGGGGNSKKQKRQPAEKPEQAPKPPTRGKPRGAKAGRGGKTKK